MTRPTHLVTLPNSVGLLRLFGFASGSARLSVRRAQNAHTLASLVHFSASRRSKITFSASSLDRRKPNSSHPAMDPHAASANAEGENFVHIENPGADESLSESIVNIEEEPPSGDDDDSTSYEDESSEQTKPVLPEELSRSVVVLTCDSVAKGGVCDVYLVGTAHVSQSSSSVGIYKASLRLGQFHPLVEYDDQEIFLEATQQESCREVQAVISFLKPQVVFLELCSSRVAVLTPQNIKVPTMGEMLDMWKKKHSIFGILYSWFLAKVASKLEVFPGSEFRVAYEEAMKYGGRVFLGDLPVQITIRRTWAKMPLWHKIKLLFSLFFQAVFLPSSEDLNRMLKEMDDVDMLTLVIQEMSKEFPTLMETLVHERDKYMSSSLLRIASENSLVVAVVGKGHLQGIKKNWKQPIGVKDLLTMPPQKPTISTVNILRSLGVAVAGVAILSGIYLANKK